MYWEAELAAARDFFLSPANFDETDPTRFYPAVIESLLRNMSGQTVLHYYSSWNHSACHPKQVTLPIPSWPAHSICCLPSLVPPPARQKSCHRRLHTVTNVPRRNIPSSSLSRCRFSGRGTAHDPITLDPVINEAGSAQLLLAKIPVLGRDCHGLLPD
jgi:hypothetical protein